MTKRIHSRSVGLVVVALTGSLVSGPLPSLGSPVLSGDVEALFELQPDDCSGCSQAQLDELESGLDFALRRLRGEVRNPFNQVCVAEASLIRDMTVMIFQELRLPGIISNQRWREFIQAKAIISGGLSEVTKSNLLAGLEDQVERSDLMDGLISAQYSRIFEAIAEGRWDFEDWLSVAGSTRGGFDPVIDFLLSANGPGRAQLDQIVAASRPAQVWLEGQMWHLTRLPDDFAAGSTPTLAAALREEYEAEIAGNPWTVGANGCGIEAAHGLRDYALESSQGYQLAARSSVDTTGTDTPFDDYQGEPVGAFDDIITVIADKPILNTVLGGTGIGLPFFNGGSTPSTPGSSGEGPSSEPGQEENPETGNGPSTHCGFQEAMFMNQVQGSGTCPSPDEVRSYNASTVDETAAPEGCQLSDRAMWTLVSMGCFGGIAAQQCTSTPGPNPSFCEFCVGICTMAGGEMSSFGFSGGGSFGLGTGGVDVGSTGSVSCTCTGR